MYGTCTQVLGQQQSTEGATDDGATGVDGIQAIDAPTNGDTYKCDFAVRLTRHILMI